MFYLQGTINHGKIMRNKLFLSLATLAAVLVIVGCKSGQDNSGKAIKMQRSSGKMNHDSVDVAWYAVCKTITTNGHPAEWQGPLRTDKERAMRDANDHMKQFSDHTAEVKHH